MGFLQPHGRHRRGDGEAAVRHFSSCPAACRGIARLRCTERQDRIRSGRVKHAALRRMRRTRSDMTQIFRTLDDVDVKGKRVLLRVDLNVPMENGRVTDATRLERVAPTITEISGKGGKVILLAHFGRPKGRDAKDSLKPVAAALATGDQEAGRLRRRLHRRGRGQGRRRDEGRRHPLPGKHPLPQGRRKERSGLRGRTGKARRHLGQRRVLGRAPRACLDRRPRPQAAGLCRPHHAGRTRRAGQGAGSADQAGHRDHRRRQGLDQDRPAGKPRQQGRCAGDRRRHGQYLPARAGRRRRQVAGGEGSRGDRAAHHGKGRGCQLRHHPAGRRRGRLSFRGQLRRRTPMASTRSRPTA